MLSSYVLIVIYVHYICNSLIVFTEEFAYTTQLFEPIPEANSDLIQYKEDKIYFIYFAYNTKNKILPLNSTFFIK